MFFYQAMWDNVDLDIGGVTKKVLGMLLLLKK